MGNQFDVIIIGGSFSGAAAAKRLVDAGLRTLVIERFRLPRHKPCSGIVSPRGHRFLIENFGPLPPEALHEPRACRGVTFHYPSKLSMPMDFHHGPTPHLFRKYSDQWALRQSGAEVYDGTRFISLEDSGDGVEIVVRREKETRRLKARYVIGADGPNSAVVRSLYPDYRHSIPWFAVKQFFHQIIDCPLDDEYFHFWVHPDLGFYTWSHRRDGGQILGVGYGAGDNLETRHEKVLSYMEEHHGVRLAPTDDREGSVNNFGLSLTNRYVFGKGKVLVTGQAAGFLNMIAEGMSCALHSGAIAGEAVVDAIRFNTPVQDVYRKMVSSEVRRCSDQWNPFKVIFGNPHEADFMAALGRHTVGERLQITRDIISFLKPWGRYKWGRQILWQALVRQLLDGYSPSRWM
ncbi:FAD-dependent monooxygenase [Nitrospirota bacterium]